MATAFSSLLKILWSGRYKHFAPTTFRTALSHISSSPFDGSPMEHQQDSQEFLAFLLDALHEDVNRVTQKKYSEDKKNDTPASAWGGYLSRNQSVVVDLFHGLAKSNLLCDKCGHQSTSYDPLMYLQVPVASCQQPSRCFYVVYVPLDAGAPPVFKAVKVSKDGVIGDIANQLNPHSKQIQKVQMCIVKSELEVHHVSHSVQVESIPNGVMLAGFEHLPIKMPDYEEEEENTDVLIHLMNVDHTVDSQGEESDGEASLPSLDTMGFVRCDHLTSNVELYDAVRESRPASRLVRITFCYDNPDSVIPDDPDPANGHAVLHLFSAEIRRGVPPSHPKIITLYAHWDLYTYSRQDPIKHPSVHEAGLDHVGGGKDITLHDCLTRWGQEEQLDDDNKWACEGCGVRTNAFKKMGLWTLPEYLVVQLKKFSYSAYGVKKKSDLNVTFPIRGLDMTPYLDPKAPRKPNPTYDLYAVIPHYGSANMGHFTAYAYNIRQRVWLSYDDEAVMPVPEETVQRAPAYLLFYKRREDGLNEDDPCTNDEEDTDDS
eukprot:TRINITY_DN11468_c0_g1_i4.p1 TRINITY_DN11468_c0_g1~~TRINITY_DN11468_c0_g1_i4.p1  ORF type:complete len:605 (+),score=62.55 TRINITY_DN11468_c0_g1_i4:187-1815(+)